MKPVLLPPGKVLFLVLFLVAGGVTSLAVGDSTTSQPAQDGGANQDPVGKGDDKPKPDDSRVRGRKLLDEVIEAMGGAEALANLKTLRWRAVESRLLPSGSLLERNILGRTVLPDRMRIDIDFFDPGQRRLRKVTFCLDRDKGWQKVDADIKDMTSSIVAQQKSGLQIATTPLLKAHATLDVRELDASQLGTKTYRVLMVSKKDIGPVLFWIDPETKRIARRKTTLVSQGKRVVREEQLWDYRKVDGLMLPFSRKVFQDGEQLMLMSITSYKLNEGYGDEVYAKPAAGS